MVAIFIEIAYYNINRTPHTSHVSDVSHGGDIFILGEIIVDISDGVRENHSKAGHDYQIIKQPKTYEQQVELNTKIIFKDKIYDMNTIDEVSSRLIRVFS